MTSPHDVPAAKKHGMELLNNESVLDAGSASDLPTRPRAALPTHPLVSIRPGRRWALPDLRALWAYRELLYFLTWRDVKVRYKQTALGAAWAILQPLLLMLIFSFFFGRLAGIKSDGVPYPLFAYSGLLPWTFFASAVTNSGNSLIGSSNLITKVYFPRMLIPAAAVASGLVDLAIAFLLLVGLMFYYGTGLHASLLALPLMIALATGLAAAVGMWMAALNVKYRDVRYALPFLIQVWMFASPVIYPVPERWRWLLALNPMTGIVQGFRSALLGRPFDSFTLGLSTALTLVFLVYAMISFSRMEKSFADLI
ncbi:MAG: ABC transporter permease [Pyrinomonadaceae bacterium]